MRRETPFLLSVTAAAAAAALVSTAATAQGIGWAKSLDMALERAKAEAKVIMIALNMDGERANDQMVREHYRDPALVKLSRHTINLFCSNNVHNKSGTCSRCRGNSCATHRENDFQVRRKIFKVDGSAAIVAPQHLFLSPAGEIISSASYYLTKGELEWMWVDAIKTVDRDFSWELSGRSRAPERLKKKDVDSSTLEKKPPTKEEFKAALDAIRKLGAGNRGRGGRGGRGGGRGAWRKILEQAEEQSDILIRSDDPKALNWGTATLRGYRMFRNGLITKIGDYSPKVWTEVIEEWLDHREDDTRLTAVMAIEKLANPKSLTRLRKALKKEKVNTIEGRFLRAIAAVAPSSRAAISLVSKAVKSHKDELVRSHAVVAAGKLEDRKAVTACLTKALQDESKKVRSVAAYVIAIRLDKELLPYLEVSLRAEVEKDTKSWMEKAVEAIGKKDHSAFAGFLEKTLPSEVVEASGERGRGGRGEGPRRR